MSITPTAQYSLTIRVEIDHRPGMLGQVATAIGEAGGIIGAVDLDRGRPRTSCCATSPSTPPTRSTWDAITGGDRRRRRRARGRHHRPHLPAARRAARSSSATSTPLKTRDDLSMAYTPGVARVCMAIAEDRDKAFQYTIKRNTVAVVSDGTAVLGPRRHRPGGRDAGDGGQGDALQGVRRRRRLPDLPGHQGPRRDRRDGEAHRARLRRHQPRGHLARRAASRSRSASRPSSTSPSSTTTSTAPRSSSLAALLNACKLTGRELADLRVLVIGLGAAGVAVTKILMKAGVRNIVGCRLARALVSTERADYVDGT